ncbi:hypothetical protein [Halosimplex amylolyticum]|uniref:hypothetical protein n=1 Tax=Halosimplex amylolyticum TaxID=3396616 RepID=UPI003F576480
MAEDTSGVDDDAGRNGEPNSGSDPANGDGSVTRRRLLASGAATWATASISGCQYITDPGTGDSDDTATPTVTTETTTTDDPVDQQTPTPSEDAGDTSAPTPSEGDGTPSGTPTGTPTPTETPTPPPTTTACSLAGQFAAGMEVGLHVSVYDPETGEALGADALDRVTVEFPGADYGPLELNWAGDHEAYAADTWGSKIATDTDTERGTYRYEVSVEGDDADVETTVSDRFIVV